MVVAKTGMGSSAALVSSLVGALLSFFGAATLPSLDDDAPGQEPPLVACGPGVSESLDLTHNLAQACHCVAQGKVSQLRGEVHSRGVLQSPTTLCGHSETEKTDQSLWLYVGDR